MLKKITENVFPIVIMAIVQIIIAYYFNNQDRKIVIIGESSRVSDSTACQIFYITNESDNDIDSLMIFGIKTFHLSLVSTNIPLQTSYIDSVLVLNKILAKKNYTSRICYNNSELNQNTKSSLSILNASSKGFEVINGRDVASKMKVNWIQIIITTILAVCIYAFFLILMQWHLNKRLEIKKEENESMKEQLNSNDNKYKELKAEYEQVKQEVNETYQRTQKFRILYSKNLKDYKRENDFYKKIIEKTIGINTPEDKSNLFEFVRKELKTYSTKDNFDVTSETVDLIELFAKEKK